MSRANLPTEEKGSYISSRYEQLWDTGYKISYNIYGRRANATQEIQRECATFSVAHKKKKKEIHQKDFFYYKGNPVFTWKN